MTSPKARRRKANRDLDEYRVLRAWMPVLYWWLRRRNRARLELLRKIAAAGAAYIRERMRTPSLFEELFRKEEDVDFIITGYGVNFGTEGYRDFATPSPQDLVVDVTLGLDRSKDKVTVVQLGRVEGFSLTGRRIAPIHEIQHRGPCYIPGKTSGELTIEHLDYGPLEARVAAAAALDADKDTEE